VHGLEIEEGKVPNNKPVKGFLAVKFKMAVVAAVEFMLKKCE